MWAWHRLKGGLTRLTVRLRLTRCQILHQISRYCLLVLGVAYAHERLLELTGR